MTNSKIDVENFIATQSFLRGTERLLRTCSVWELGRQYQAEIDRRDQEIAELVTAVNDLTTALNHTQEQLKTALSASAGVKL